MAREIPKLPTTTGPGKLITDSPFWNSYLIEKNFITHAVLSTSCLYFCDCIFTHHGADTFGRVADWVRGSGSNTESFAQGIDEEFEFVSARGQQRHCWAKVLDFAKY